ncbi:MAG: hypothetical protein MUF49_10390 [Oculatellaceae cyanobacterium Prado106]|nr:hypothetical protein [Oculatellaceae cyanobacterium Prado106]
MTPAYLYIWKGRRLSTVRTSPRARGESICLCVYCVETAERSIAQPEYAVPLDASDRASANFAAAVAQTEPEVQQSLLLPYLSFGAIALSCTVGCLMLSQVLKSPPSPRLTRSSFLSHSQPTQTIPGQTEEFQTPPAQSEDSSVTIVPEDQSHPLDWDEPSLADSLDLRQRRPLSYWL